MFETTIVKWSEMDGRIERKLLDRSLNSHPVETQRTEDILSLQSGVHRVIGHGPVLTISNDVEKLARQKGQDQGVDNAEAQHGHLRSVTPRSVDHQTVLAARETFSVRSHA